MGYNEYVAYYYLDRFFGKYSLEQDEVNWQCYFTYDEKVSSLVFDVTEKNPLVSKWENTADRSILEIEGVPYDGESFSFNGQSYSLMEQYGNYVRMSCNDGEKLFCISNDGNTLWQLRLVEEGDVGQLEAEYTRSSPYKSKQTPIVQHKSLFRTWISNDTGEEITIDSDSFNGMGYSVGRDIVYENQDEYVLWDFSRLARNTKDLLSLIEQFQAKGINLISCKENMDISTPTGKLLLTMVGAINEFERANLLERQREGISLAKASGKFKGRKEICIPDFEEHYARYMARKVSKIQLAQELKVSRPTLDRMIRTREEN